MWNLGREYLRAKMYGIKCSKNSESWVERKEDKILAKKKEAVLDHVKCLTVIEGPPCREDDTER